MRWQGFRSSVWLISIVASGCDGASEPVELVPVIFTSISAHGHHTCALGDDSAAYCWGRNTRGQLGDGTTSNKPEPVRVSGDVRFVLITSGDMHTCGLAESGRAYCWGHNDRGQLGDGSTSDRLTPVAIAGDISFAHLDAGFKHTCGIDTAGQAWCWGSNSIGQLGDGSIAAQSEPVKVVGGTDYIAISSGFDHTCAIADGGAAFCWGSNGEGQLGDSTRTQRLTPVAVSRGIAFAALSTGNQFTCGLSTAGHGYCWGSNTSSRLGDGKACDSRQPAYPCSELRREFPAAVMSTNTFVALDAGWSHACATTHEPQAFCWGGNILGTLGVGTFSMDEEVPLAVAGSHSFEQITASSSHSCALTPEGLAYCWGGTGEFTELGTGLDERSTVPLAVKMPVRPSQS